MTGRLKGLAFTQTRPPRRPTSEDQARLQDRWTARTHAFTVPCSPPPGGWPVEPANVHDDIDVTAMMDAFRAYATCQPDFAGWYPGRSGSPNDSARPTALGTRTTSEPGQLVMVAAFTGDLNRHRAELRKIWPGALCVTAARRTNADRRTIDRAVHELFASRRFDPVKLLNTAPSPLGDTVLAHVTVGTAELRAELDQRFGTGAVELIAKLRPVAD